MGSLRLHAYKIHAIKKHNSEQFVNNVFLYIFSALAFTLSCSSPLWYPSFSASKVLFIVGNVIVIYLVGESKFFNSCPNTSCKSPKFRVLSCNLEQAMEAKHSSARDSYSEVMSHKVYDEWERLPAEELTKLADDFIARMNRKTRFEAQFF